MSRILNVVHPTMVNSLDKRWNTVCPSLLKMYEKLEKLGVDNKIS